MNELLELEFSILDWIAAHLHCAFLDVVMPFLTRLGDHGFLWILLALILICIPKERRSGIEIIIALTLSLLVCNVVLKNLTVRVRPFDIQTGIDLLIAAPHDYSFPSGHTSTAFAATMVLLRNRAPWRYAALLFAVLMGFSRLYLYVHFPTDVLVGALIGLGVGYLACRICELDNKDLRNRRNEGG